MDTVSVLIATEGVFPLPGIPFERPRARSPAIHLLFDYAYSGVGVHPFVLRSCIHLEID